jgi:hypothetical protein
MLGDGLGRDREADRERDGEERGDGDGSGDRRDTVAVSEPAEGQAMDAAEPGVRSSGFHVPDPS